MPPGSAAIDDLLDRVPALTGRPRTVRELPGGLTNRNYHVVTPDGGYVARVWSAGSELLAIDRDCEYRNSVTAAQAGAATTSTCSRSRPGTRASPQKRACASRRATTACARSSRPSGRP